MFSGNLMRAVAALAFIAMVGFVVACNESKSPSASQTGDDQVATTQAVIGVESQDVIEITTCSGRHVTVVNWLVALDAMADGDITGRPAITQIDRDEMRRTGPDTVMSRSDFRGPWINQALADTGVQYEIATWQSMGYEFSRSNSVVIRGRAVPENSTDTVSVVVVDLVLAYTADPFERFAAVEYAYSPEADAPVVQSSITSFVNPQDVTFDSLYLATDGSGDHCIWVKDFEPFGWDRGFDWKRYRKCVIAHTAVACLSAGVGCVAAGPGYPACVATGCTTAAGAAAVACALEQLL